jgi:hypothetical protein
MPAFTERLEMSVPDLPVTDDEPMIIRSPLGVEVLVYREADGRFRVDAWKSFFFVEQGVLVEKQLADPTPEIRARRFGTIGEVGNGVDRQLFGAAHAG